MKQKSLWLKTSPAHAIISKLGGVQEVARLLAVNPSSVTRWLYPRPAGSGGVIPSRHLSRLLSIADAMGVDITPEDLRWRKGEAA